MIACYESCRVRDNPKYTSVNIKFIIILDLRLLQEVLKLK